VIRSHVLLRCPNAKIRTAGAEAGEGKRPGGFRAMPANRRCERWCAKTLELSWLGIAIGVRTDKDCAHASKIDEWVECETVNGTGLRGEG
jgi:hypothetical protein